MNEQGLIQASAGQSHIIHPFPVEAGAEWIAFKVAPRPREDGKPVTLADRYSLGYYIFVFDSADRLRLHYYIVYDSKYALIHREPGATSYAAVPGPLPVGEWQICIVPNNPARGPYSYDVTWQQGSGAIPAGWEIPAEERDYWSTASTDRSVFSMNLLDRAQIKQPAARWYRGDLHVHTHLSDGTTSPAEVMQEAEMCGFDFLMIADHNLMMPSWPRGQDRVMFVPGVELSTRWGDMNIIGLSEGPDFRELINESGIADISAILRYLRQTREAGAIVCMNHPFIQGGYWNFGELPLDEIDVLEIWNYACHPSQPEAVEHTLKIWNFLWNDGRTLPGVSGTDSHGGPIFPRTAQDPPFVDWNLLLFIYANGLSVDHLLQGILQRQVYATRGPYLDAEITVGTEKFGIGADVTQAVDACAGETAEVNYVLRVSNPGSGAIHWIEDGREVAVQPVAGEGDYGFRFCWRAGEYHWARAEIRALNGSLQAFVNPIFSGRKEPVLHTWQELLDVADIGDSFRQPYALHQAQKKDREDSN